MTAREQQLLQWLESGVGVFADELAAAMDRLPAETLAARLAVQSGLPAVDLAYILARRHDPRGVAALAGAVAWPLAAARALRYLDTLDMLDMVPPPWRTEAARDRALALEQLGAVPDELTTLVSDRRCWPGTPDPVRVSLFRFREGTAGAGLLLVRPTPARIDGHLARLEPAAALALACGHCFAFQVVRVNPETFRENALVTLLEQPAHRDLTAPQLVGAWRFGAEVVLEVEARRAGQRGFLLAGALESAPAGWFPADHPADTGPLTADQAFWLWFGQILLEAAADR